MYSEYVVFYLPRHSGIYYIYVELVPVHWLLQYYNVQMYGMHEYRENARDSKNDVQIIKIRKNFKVL